MAFFSERLTKICLFFTKGARKSGNFASKTTHFSKEPPLFHQGTSNKAQPHPYLLREGIQVRKMLPLRGLRWLTSYKKHSYFAGHSSKNPKLDGGIQVSTCPRKHFCHSSVVFTIITGGGVPKNTDNQSFQGYLRRFTIKI